MFNIHTFSVGTPILYVFSLVHSAHVVALQYMLCVSDKRSV